MHKIIEIKCACGNTRIARRDRVNRGEITCCAACSHKRASEARRKPVAEKAITEAHHIYKSNAKRKGNIFSLTKEQTNRIFHAYCHYCGVENSMGIDRLNNEEGYTMSNAVPCCRICNYAKRDMKLADFLSWIRRVHAHAKHKGFL